MVLTLEASEASRSCTRAGKNILPCRDVEQLERGNGERKHRRAGGGASGEEQKGWSWNQPLDGNVALAQVEEETGDMAVLGDGSSSPEVRRDFSDPRHSTACELFQLLGDADTSHRSVLPASWRQWSWHATRAQRPRFAPESNPLGRRRSPRLILTLPGRR